MVTHRAKKNGRRYKRDGDEQHAALVELQGLLGKTPTTRRWLAKHFNNTPRTIASWVTMLREEGLEIYMSNDCGELAWFIPGKKVRR